MQNELYEFMKGKLDIFQNTMGGKFILIVDSNLFKIKNSGL